MRDRMRKRSILMAVLTLLLCFALLAVGTYALFTVTVPLKNHLEADTLDIELVRTNLKATILDSKTGALTQIEDGRDVDFTSPTNKNLFGLDQGTRIAPGFWYSADVDIKNVGDLDCYYWIEIELPDSGAELLAEQLQVTVTTENGSFTAKASECAGFIGSETEPIGMIAFGTTKSFTVRVEFINLDADLNNSVNGQTVNFDIIVHAVQTTDEDA